LQQIAILTGIVRILTIIIGCACHT
jgi:hypothetical protein